jgi:hypothetical protein
MSPQDRNSSFERQNGGPKKDEQKSQTQNPLQDAIRHRAEEIYRQGGAAEGHDLENWRQAEAEVLRESGTHLTRAAVVINLGGVVYTGEYDFAAAGDYMAGEWQPGDRVSVRLEGDRLFLRRPNGSELQTQVVKRIG